MSIRVMTQVWQHSKHKSGALVVLLAIADFANDNGEAFPSVETLAAKGRMTGRQVQRVVEDLKASGELIVKKGAGPHGTNVYRIALSEGDKLSGRQFVGVTFEADRGDISGSPGVTPASPKPSLNGHLTGVRASARHTHTVHARAQGAQQGAADPQTVLDLVSAQGHVVGLSRSQRTAIEESGYTTAQIAEGWAAALDGTWEKWKAKDPVFNYILADLPEYFAKQNARTRRPKNSLNVFNGQMAS